MNRFLALLLIRLSKREAKNDPVSGEMIMDYGWLMRALAFLGTALPFVLALATFLIDPPGKQHNDRVASGLLALGLLEGCLVFETIGVRILLGDGGIVGLAPWRLPRSISWGEIIEVSYSPAMGRFTVKGATGTKIRVSLLISGMGTFVKEMRSRCDPSVYEKAQPGIAILGL